MAEFRFSAILKRLLMWIAEGPATLIGTHFAVRHFGKTTSRRIGTRSTMIRFKHTLVPTLPTNATDRSLCLANGTPMRIASHLLVGQNDRNANIEISCSVNMAGCVLGGVLHRLPVDHSGNPSGAGRDGRRIGKGETRYRTSDVAQRRWDAHPR